MKCPDCGKICKSEHGVKVHQQYCPGTPEPVRIEPVKMVSLADSIRRVKELAEDVGGLEELRKACDILLVEQLR